MAFDEGRAEVSAEILEKAKAEIKIRLDLYELIEVKETTADFVRNIDMIGVTWYGKPLKIQHKSTVGTFKNGNPKNLVLDQYFDKFPTGCIWDKESMGVGKDGREGKYRALYFSEADFIVYNYQTDLYIFDTRILNRVYVQHRNLFIDKWNEEHQPIGIVSHDKVKDLLLAYRGMVQMEAEGFYNNNGQIWIK